MAASTVLRATPSLKRSHSDMRSSRPLSKWVDEDYYRNYVLHLPIGTNEEEIDQNLKHEAEELGVNQLQITTNIENLTSSLSATTIASDPTHQSSIMSQSTAPTSCSSSDHRPVTSPTAKSEYLPSPSSTTSIIAEMEKKRRNSGFRNGIRKMAGFSRKRKSLNLHSPTTLSSIGSGSMSDVDSVTALKDVDASSIRKSIDLQSLNSSTHNYPLKSPSIKSSKSSDVWSNRLSTLTTANYEPEVREALIDHEALRRSIECTAIMSLRARQLEERQRLLDYQLQLVSNITKRKEEIKTLKQETHRQVLAGQTEKNEKAIEELESRQLEEELKMLKEHDTDKLKILTRLRHMEAYCQTPSPPPTPIEPTFSVSHSGSDRTSSSTSNPRTSLDSTTAVVLPERRITDRDYHSLAASYRERDAMDNLHASRINVLRGRQKRAVENFTLKKERELERLELEQQRELDAVDLDFAQQEAQCRQEFRDRVRLLERRWKIQAMIEKTRQDKLTGLKHEMLPDVRADDNEGLNILTLLQ